jgi:hypothetical protein
MPAINNAAAATIATSLMVSSSLPPRVVRFVRRVGSLAVSFHQRHKHYHAERLHHGWPISEGFYGPETR